MVRTRFSKLVMLSSSAHSSSLQLLLTGPETPLSEVKEVQNTTGCKVNSQFGTFADAKIGPKADPVEDTGKIGKQAERGT